MPVTPNYPGVYVEEIPSGSQTITGVATSITAFIGRAKRGPVNEPILINNYGEFERIFGGLWEDSTLGFAVRDFYNNGGSQAVIVRLFHPRELQAKNIDKVDEVLKFDEVLKLKEVLKVVNEIKNAKDAIDGIEKARKYLETDGGKYQPKNWPVQKKLTGKIAKMIAIEIKKFEISQLGIEDKDRKDYKEEVEKIIAKLTSATKTRLSVDKPNKQELEKKARLSVGDEPNKQELEAAEPGAWGNELRARVDYNGIAQGEKKLFNLSVRDGCTGVVETFLNVSVEQEATRYVEKVLEKDSKLVRLFGNAPDNRPKDNLILWEKRNNQNQVDESHSVKHQVENAPEIKKITEDKKKKEAIAAEKNKFKAEGLWYKHCSNGVDVYKAGDGVALKGTDFTDGQSEKKGIYALENADLFNLLCIPPYNKTANGLDVETTVLTEAIAYCVKRRAMLIIDAPSGWNSKKAAKDGIDGDVGSTSKNAAIFFPRLKMPNPLKDNQMEIFAACGAVAGVMARTDATRGVWKAPAGLDAVLRGVADLSVPLTDAENGELNPLGINCLRVKPPAGKIIWGARTREGNDMLASEWKYIPVRRLALYLEETLYRNTKWAVFEPNDEPLWAQLRLSIGAFMNNLFRQGAFQGSSPKDAYFVKCDKETTTQYDIDRGIVNIIIGFAPLKPAEFVILKFQQIAGQS
ncbi:MAG: phage tail sheath subtilisin-like domain-containing protein [Hormoscilla sp. GUM202]|nr:phage tail sheath subtilisin-like domain-containing protein [Hormoscilla sp. GUM202]